MGSCRNPYGNRRKHAGARFTIGRDHHGWWIVHDRLDRVGGIFISEDAAARFAAEESGHDASEICTATTAAVIELFDGEKHTGSIGQSILDNNSRLRQMRGGGR